MNGVNVNIQPEGGFESRWFLITQLWQRHQWLYLATGTVFGMIIGVTVGTTHLDFRELAYDLLPEVFGALVAVFLIDRLYKYFEKTRILSGVKTEILVNLSRLTFVSDPDRIIALNTKWARFLRNEFENMTPGLRGYTKVKSAYVNWLNIYLISTLGRGRSLETQHIDSALTSDALLTMNVQAPDGRITIYQALADLRENINQRRLIDEMLAGTLKKLQGYSEGVERDEKVIISNWDIVPAMACVDREENIFLLTSSIVNAINTRQNTIVQVELHPSSPLSEEVEQISKERPSIPELQRWLDEYSTAKNE